MTDASIGAGRQGLTPVLSTPTTGVNYYGAETEKNTLEGLDVRHLDDILQFLQDNDFNALRIPFSLMFALSLDEVVTGTTFVVRFTHESTSIHSTTHRRSAGHSTFNKIDRPINRPIQCPMLTPGPRAERHDEAPAPEPRGGARGGA